MTRFFHASAVILLIIVTLAVIITGCSSPAPASPEPTAAPTPVPTATISQSISAMTMAMVPQETTAMTTPQATSSTSSSGGGPTVAVTVTAENFLFDQKTITVPAGATVVMTFINKDAGIPHNVAIYTDNTATKKIFVGDIANGVKTMTYTFTAPSIPGNYYFRCDVHPTLMFGTFVVT